jgi:uncharacterized protein YndB with AHSA1/START domain
MGRVTVTSIHQTIHAPRERVYEALIDPAAVARWRVPAAMTCEVDEFETDEPALRGEMTMTVRLADVDGGTELVAAHEGLPEGISPADNEAGWQEALARLAALVESSD